MAFDTVGFVVVADVVITGVSAGGSCLVLRDERENGEEGMIEAKSSLEGSLVPRGDVGGLLFPCPVVFVGKVVVSTSGVLSTCVASIAVAALSMATMALVFDLGDFGTLFFIDWNDAGVNFPLSCGVFKLFDRIFPKTVRDGSKPVLCIGSTGPVAAGRDDDVDLSR